jgi:hypothetical protein
MIDEHPGVQGAKSELLETSKPSPEPRGHTGRLAPNPNRLESLAI